MSRELVIEITEKSQWRKKMSKVTEEKQFGKKVWGKGTELVTTDPTLDIDDTSPRKNYVLGGSTELGRSGPNSGSSYSYPRPWSASVSSSVK